MNRISSRLDAGVSGAISGGFRGFPGVSGLMSKMRAYQNIQFPGQGAGFPPHVLDNLKLKKENGAGDE